MLHLCRAILIENFDNALQCHPDHKQMLHIINSGLHLVFSKTQHSLLIMSLRLMLHVGHLNQLSCKALHMQQFMGVLLKQQAVQP